TTCRMDISSRQDTGRDGSVSGWRRMAFQPPGQAGRMPAVHGASRPNGRHGLRALSATLQKKIFADKTKVRPVKGRTRMSLHSLLSDLIGQGLVSSYYSGQLLGAHLALSPLAVQDHSIPCVKS